jgi:RNase P subunit RPR2
VPVEPLILKCNNLLCDPATLLVQLEVRTVKLSMWRCPKCRYVYFYSHTEQQLSEGLKPKP